MKNWVALSVLALLTGGALSSCCTTYNGLVNHGTNQRIQVQVWKPLGCSARLTTNPPSEWGAGNYVIPANVSFYDTNNLSSKEALWLYLSKARSYTVTVSSPCYPAKTIKINSSYCQLDKSLVQIKLASSK